MDSKTEILYIDETSPEFSGLNLKCWSLEYQLYSDLQSKLIRLVKHISCDDFITILTKVEKHFSWRLRELYMIKK